MQSGSHLFLFMYPAYKDSKIITLHSNSRLVSSSYTNVTGNNRMPRGQEYSRSQRICIAELSDAFTCSTISAVSVGVPLATALLLTALNTLLPGADQDVVLR